MNYKIKLDFTLDAAALQALLRTLDAGPHGLMRGIIDSIIEQAKEQEAANVVDQAPQQNGLTD
jgi:hypothetical protein